MERRASRVSMEGWGFRASIRAVGSARREGPNLELLEPNRPDFESCLHCWLYNLSKLLKFLYFLISKLESFYLPQKLCKIKRSPDISHTLMRPKVFLRIDLWYLSERQLSSQRTKIYLKITNYTLHLGYGLLMLYFHYAMLCSLILLFLMADQLIKFSEHVTG